jgi:hypothetical protein
VWNDAPVLDVLAIVVVVAFFVGCAAFVRGSARIIGEVQSSGEGRVGDGRPEGGDGPVPMEARDDEAGGPSGSGPQEPVGTQPVPRDEQVGGR